MKIYKLKKINKLKKNQQNKKNIYLNLYLVIFAY